MSDSRRWCILGLLIVKKVKKTYTFSQKNSAAYFLTSHRLFDTIFPSLKHDKSLCICPFIHQLARIPCLSDIRPYCLHPDLNKNNTYRFNLAFVFLNRFCTFFFDFLLYGIFAFYDLTRREVSQGHQVQNCSSAYHYNKNGKFTIYPKE